MIKTYRKKLQVNDMDAESAKMLDKHGLVNIITKFMHLFYIKTAWILE